MFIGDPRQKLAEQNHFLISFFADLMDLTKWKQSDQTHIQTSIQGLFRVKRTAHIAPLKFSSRQNPCPSNHHPGVICLTPPGGHFPEKKQERLREG